MLDRAAKLLFEVALREAQAVLVIVVKPALSLKLVRAEPAKGFEGCHLFVSTVAVLPQLNAALQKGAVLDQIATNIQQFLLVPSALSILLQGLADNHQQHCLLYQALSAHMSSAAAAQVMQLQPCCS